MGTHFSPWRGWFSQSKRRIIAWYPEEYQVPHGVGNSKIQLVKDFFWSLYHLLFPPHSYFLDTSFSFPPYTIPRPEQNGSCPGPVLQGICSCFPSPLTMGWRTHRLKVHAHLEPAPLQDLLQVIKQNSLPRRSWAFMGIFPKVLLLGLRGSHGCGCSLYSQEVHLCK